MLHSRIRSTRTIALLAALLIALAAILPLSACSKKKKYVAPATLSREGAALYTAIAFVCPKDQNHSKMDYLTFHFEGWSFEEPPREILDYLNDYCRTGSAALLQFSYDDLVAMGYIKSGEDDSFFENQNVYADGLGKIFTFTLPEGQDVESDHLIVSVTGYISDNDYSGFDVELEYSNNAWNALRFSNTWYQDQFNTPDPDSTTEPQK